MPPYAFVTARGDTALTIVDVANPAAPTVVGSIQGAGAPNFLQDCRGIYVRGAYAYVTSAQFGDALTIFNISNPAVPVHVGAIVGAGAPNWLGQAWDVFVLGDYAYVASRVDDALTIFNISNPAVPVHVGVIRGGLAPNHLDGARGVHVIGNYAYVVSELANALTIIDVANPAAPTLVVASLLGGLILNPLGIYVIGNYAYIACSLGNNRLVIADVSNPAAPFATGSIAGAGAPNFLWGAWKVFVRSSYAYVSAALDNALTIVDVANPAAPTVVGSIQGPGAPNFLGGARGIRVRDDFAYLAAFDDNALTIININNPAAPVFAGSVQGIGAPNWLQQAVGVFMQAGMPAVSTDPATAVGVNEAIVNGTLTDDGGEACSVFFEYGENPALGSSTVVKPGYISGQSFSQPIAGLTHGRIYYFRAVATNSSGSSYGAVRSFVCTGAEVITLPATNITDGRARLNGQVASDAGVAGSVRFQWGQTAAYGMETSSMNGYVTGDAFFADIGLLAEGTAYHFRAVFENRFGAVYGADKVFSTSVPLGPVTWVSDELLLMQGMIR